MSTSVFKSDGHLRRQLLAGLWGLLSAGIIQPSANAEEGDPLAEIQADERSPTERGPTNQGSNEPETSQRSELADFSGPSLDGSVTIALNPPAVVAVPLNVAFANPRLAASLGMGAIAAGLGSEPQYKNDEQIDNQLRSILSQLPDEAVQDTSECLDGPTMHECFMLASDVGSIDVFRARDHGIARYNDLRESFGLSRVSSFTEITGELSEEFPLDDAQVDTTDPINDPDSLDFVELRDVNGQLLVLGSEAADTQAVSGVRRTSLAARLKAVYSDVDNMDGFVGMISESHLSGSEFGPLQYAMWKQQFEALRDGDSNFYLWNESLRQIMRDFSSDRMTYRQSLADVIINNTELESGDIQAQIFLSAE